jgi:hypothetical protein
MHAIIVRTTVPMLLVLTLALSFAGEPPTPQASLAPSIEGTYQFISRKLPDGTLLRPPDFMGFNTYTKSHRIRKNRAVPLRSPFLDYCSDLPSWIV